MPWIQTRDPEVCWLSCHATIAVFWSTQSPVLGYNFLTPVYTSWSSWTFLADSHVRTAIRWLSFLAISASLKAFSASSRATWEALIWSTFPWLSIRVLCRCKFNSRCWNLVSKSFQTARNICCHAVLDKNVYWLSVGRGYSLGFPNTRRACWWNSRISLYIIPRTPRMSELSVNTFWYCNRRGICSVICW